DAAAHQQRARHRHRLDAQGRDGRPRGARPERRRRDPVHGVLSGSVGAMSRIGKKAVAIPAGVTANVAGATLSAEGRRGVLQLTLHDDVAATMEDGGVKIDPRNETKRARAMWGTSRSLLANVVAGVTKGFEKRLEITGVGYRAAVQGKNLQISLGYSHDI